MEEKTVKLETHQALLASLQEQRDRAIADLRQRRNALLSSTDFYALSDVTMSDEMKQYRQNLRDITEGLSTKKEVEAKEFPTKP